MYSQKKISNSFRSYATIQFILDGSYIVLSFDKIIRTFLSNIIIILNIVSFKSLFTFLSRTKRFSQEGDWTSYLKKKGKKKDKRKQFQKRALNVKKQSNGRIYQYLWIRGDNGRVTSPYFCPFWKHIWWKGAELLLCPLNFPPLFISVFCELSRGRCKFSSFYLSSLDKVSEPRQHARYRHVEAIYGFRLFRTRLYAFFSSNS